MSPVTDITEMKRAEAELVRQSQFLDLLFRISSAFINLPLERVDASVQAALQEMGQFVAADRAYIFDYDFAAGTMLNTFEWCAPGITPQLEELQDLSLRDFPDWVETHADGRPMNIPDVSTLAPGALREALEPQGVKSLLSLPLTGKEGCLGFVGFDSVRQKHAYGDMEVRLLHLFAQMAVNVAERKQAEGALQQKENYQRALLDNFPFLVWLKDTESRFLAVNQPFAVSAGFAQTADLQGKTDLDIWPRDLAQAYREDDRAVLTTRRKKDVEEEVSDQGRRKWFETYKAPVLGDDGELFGTVGFARDISDRKAIEETLKTERQRLRNIIEGTRAGTWEWNVETGEAVFNEQWAGIVGYRLDEIAPISIETWMRYVHPDDLERSNDLLYRHFEGKLAYYECESRMRHKAGHWVWVLDRGRVFEWNELGKPLKMAGTRQDITERKQAEFALQESEQRFRTAGKAAYDLIYEWDVASDTLEWFGDIDSLLGYEPGAVSADTQAWHELIHPEDTAQLKWALEQHRTSTKSIRYEYRIRHRDGAYRYWSDHGLPLLDAEGHPYKWVGTCTDITRQKQHQRQLEHIAHHDALTNLPNRVLLADRMHQAMAQVQRRGQRLAVAYLDLDGFKEINDRHGHDVGDLLLVSVASHLLQALREGDTIARLGGDEFVAVLLDLTDSGGGLSMLNRLLNAAAQPLSINDQLLQVSASLGVTYYPQQVEVDADLLLRQADRAMYQAKQTGRNRYHIFNPQQDPGLPEPDEGLRPIQQALEREEFVLHYQPQVNMSTGELVGAEALIRWQHGERGLLQPAEFLPEIENHALGIKLGEWIIDSALTQLEAWHAQGLEIPVSVNVGALQLQQPDFMQRLRTLLAAHPQIRRGCLKLEVVETSALEDMARVSQLMHDCREIGVSFALDDFGTGYSSLTYLKRLPAVQLKIDRSFVHDMLDDPEDLAILEGVLGLATAFRRQAIAEGVETVEHGMLLLQLGCELAQGHGIAQPMPAKELPGWAAAWRPDSSWVHQQAVRRKDLPLLFAIVEHRAWIRAIEACIKHGQRALPLLDEHLCRFGQWLDDEGRKQQGAHPAYQSIAPLHSKVHGLAGELLHLKAGGHTREARAGLSELYRLRNELLGVLKAFL